MTRGSILAVCVTLLLATTASRVAAQPRSAADRRAAAQQKFIEANDHANAGEHDAAIRAFEEAYEILPLDDFLFNIASVHRARGDAASALVYYHRYLDVAPNGRAAALARTRIAELEAAAAQQAEADQQANADADAARPAQADTAAPAGAATHAIDLQWQSEASRAAARTRARRLKIGGLAVAGAGVLAFGFGIHFGLQSGGYERRAELVRGDRTGVYDGFVRDADTASQRMYMSVATGLALAAGGGALYYYGTRVERDAVIAPVPVAGGAGLAVAGSF